ncbi:MAG: S-layer homology domain-containing protein [Clostridia bacterium]|nr:S-layer homology domain-containing protein [Clostridia bacterium]
MRKILCLFVLAGLLLSLAVPAGATPQINESVCIGETSIDDSLVNSYSENGLTFSVSPKGTKVEITGSLASTAAEKNITLLVMNPQKDIDDWGDDAAVQNQAECLTNSEGKFKISFEINTDTPDTFAVYQAFIKGQGAGNPIEFKIPLITQQAIDDALSLLNSSDETNISTNLNTAVDILLFGVEDIFSTINTDGLETKVLGKIPFIDENEAKQWLKTHIFIEALTQGKTQHLADNNGLLKYADELDISTMDLDEGLTVYNIYTTKLTDNGKAGVMSYLSGKTYQDTQAVRKEFAKAVVIEAIRNYSINGYGHINGLLNTNGAYVDLVLTNYTGDTSAKDNELLTARYASLTDIQTVVSKTTTTTPITPPSDDGGGGRGGRDYAVAPQVIENNKGVVPEIKQEPIYFINDVAKEHWAAEAINEMLKKNIISMPEDGNFRPEDFVTREEFVKLLAITFKLPEPEAVEEAFNDVPSTRWSAPYVYAAHSTGIVQGTGESTFGAEGKLTRQDMATIIYRTFKYCGLSSENKDTNKFSDDGYISDYARESIYSLYAQGAINGMGDGSFAPLGLCTRAQAAKVLYAFINKSTDN